MATKRLINLAENLWVVEYDFFNMGIHFPGRMTVIRLQNDGLWLHSPVPVDDALAEELAELGPVEHLVAANIFHHMHLPTATERYPEAKLWGAAGLDKKRKNLNFDHILGTGPAPSWSDEIEVISFAGIRVFNETVFIHRSTKSLIVTDLLMNVHESRGLMSKVIYWLEGAYGQLAVPRVVRLMVKDRAATSAAASQVIAATPERLIMTHGEVIVNDAAAQAERVFQVLRPTAQLQAGAV